MGQKRKKRRQRGKRNGTNTCNKDNNEDVDNDDSSSSSDVESDNDNDASVVSADDAEEHSEVSASEPQSTTPKRPEMLRALSLSENIQDRHMMSFKSPLATGDILQQQMQVRDKEEQKPMGAFERFKLSWGRNQKPLRQHSVHSTRKQFTVTSTAKKANSWFALRSTNPDDYAYTPNGAMVIYINWTFRTKFGVVFISFLLIFLLLVFIFGLFFKWAGEFRPQCIVVAGEDFGDNNSATTLSDGFALSWQTFTTVGYGAVYVATGNDNGDQNSCALITILCTAESFIGLAYAGICTAIMFGKIGRIQSHAQVTFGDTMCVEYGKRGKANEVRGMLSDRGIISARGILGEIDFDQVHQSSSHDNEQEITREVETNKPKKRGKLLCPIIKFQLVNQLANQDGGEILDAQMNVMVRKEQESFPYEPIARFLRVELEEPSHPFFNRVWQGRHVLDENSPLVSVDARRMISKNGGYWPESLNSPEAVRSHLRFSSVIITMTGISDISAESVQISKRYYLPDVLVGYNFAPLLYKDDYGRLTVDMNLVNDVVQQEATKAEILSDHELDRPSLHVHGENTGGKKVRFLPSGQDSKRT